MSILPFRPVLSDLGSNIWHMRSFFLLLLLTVIVDGLILYVIDVATGDTSKDVGHWVLLALDEVFPPIMGVASPCNALEAFVRKVNGFMGYVLLGLVFHAVREAFRGHNLLVSRLLFIPTEKQVRHD